MGSQFLSLITKPVSNSSLICFRIVFGLIIFIEATGCLAMGWVKETFVDAQVLFTFIGFEWLNYLKGPWMYVHYTLIAISGLGIALGLFYRFSVLCYSVLWTCTYLMQKHHYNNHYYLMIILGFFMLLVPANKKLSLDSKFGFVNKDFSCPAWAPAIFILQLTIVYFYAAVAKIQVDWLEGKSLSNTFLHYSNTRPLLSFLSLPSLPSFLAWGGLLFDLLVIPLLLFRRTRLVGVTASIVFHLFNSIVFQIGTFPYLMLGAIVFFFPSDQINNWFFKKEDKISRAASYPINPLLLCTLIIFFALQLTLPLRHWFYHGSVNWTEQGHRMSWRMMLRSKSGQIHFLVKDPISKKEWTIDPLNEGLIPGQKRAMAKTPDMIWQFVQHLKENFRKKGYKEIEVYTYCQVSLNGRPFQPYVDSTIDMAKVQWEPFNSAMWIIPFKEDGDYIKTR